MSDIEPWLLAMGGVMFCISLLGTLLALAILGMSVLDRRGSRLPRAYVATPDTGRGKSRRPRVTVQASAPHPKHA